MTSYGWPCRAPSLSRRSSGLLARLLLCRDGLSDVVPAAAIRATLCQYTQLPECAEQLVKQAREGGAPDNTTVVVADLVQA